MRTSRSTPAVVMMAAALLCPLATRAENERTNTMTPLSTATVSHEGDTALIQGLPKFGFPAKMSTYVGALEAALAVTEHPYDYTHLMGVSGLAFRTRAFRGAW
ncbi:hypothetical protein CMK11_15345 [Candidatus Poribacteria bacterium]|nr:hypothetical protein [Candidatus Poribacteria bacterium]